MKSLKDMKQKGRALRKHLEAAFGQEVSLSQAYEALAAMEGATSWNALSARLAAPTVAPTDTGFFSKIPHVRALVVSRDGKLVREFNAAGWFIQAGEVELAALMAEKPSATPAGFENGYGGGAASRALARHTSNAAELEVFFGYAFAVNDMSEKADFHCYVDSFDVAAILAFKAQGGHQVPKALALVALPEIRAVFRTLDGKASTAFDASPWFAQATHEDITDLLNERNDLGPVDFARSVGGNFCADAVALFCASTDAGLAKVYAYIKATSDVGGDCGGSDCFVREGDIEDWLEAKAEIVAAQAEGHFNRLKLIEVNLVEVLNEYDVPEDAAEWKWVESEHSFAHRGNGVEGGVWEFMVRSNKMDNADFVESIPATLLPFFKRAEIEGAAWVMFHQG